MNIIKLYHGSENIITQPKLELGKLNNDYGQGFYCTQDVELAKEWACKFNHDGFVNEYELDTSSLKVLNLNENDKTVLNWIAILLKNRTFRLDTDFAKNAKQYLLDNFYIDTTKYDVVIGYRADDSYFSYADSFVSNGLSLESLSKALKLGKLGEQIALVSSEAFNCIKYVNSLPVDKTIYYPKYFDRDSNAREKYNKEYSFDLFNNKEIYMMDILREEMKNDDPRLR